MFDVEGVRETSLTHYTAHITQGRMPYIVDRGRALLTGDVVAIIRRPERRLRSRVILADNSLYQTLTRPATLTRYARNYPQMLKGATWRTPQ